MSLGLVLTNNHTQVVCLPEDTHFPDSVKKVQIRTLGKDRILSPQGCTWDSFYLSEGSVSDDFIEECASQEQAERESF